MIPNYFSDPLASPRATIQPESSSEKSKSTDFCEIYSVHSQKIIQFWALHEQITQFIWCVESEIGCSHVLFLGKSILCYPAPKYRCTQLSLRTSSFRTSLSVFVLGLVTVEKKPCKSAVLALAWMSDKAGTVSVQSIA